jgi:peptidoglycan/xylan/chitin deacetylase (PgdA/CDA1 family)
MFFAILFLHSIRWVGIGLTFDDGPTSKSFELVDLLAEKNVPATFFPVGLKLREQPSFVRYATERGFSFGNHTYDHTELPQASLPDLERTVTRQHRLLIHQGALEPTWFRFPSGKRTMRASSTLSSLGYSGIALWDVTSGDISNKSTEYAFNKTLSVFKSQDFAIVLFHDCSLGVVTRVKRFLELVEKHNSEVNPFIGNSIFLTFVLPETPFPRRPDHVFISQHVPLRKPQHRGGS